MAYKKGGEHDPHTSKNKIVAKYAHKFEHNAFAKKMKGSMDAALNAKVKDEIPKGLRRK